MDERVEFIFDVRKTAGVSYTDLSRLTGISRETLYRWSKGAPAKDRLRLRIAYTYAMRFEKACKADLLPLKEKGNAKQRLQRYREIVASMAK